MKNEKPITHTVVLAEDDAFISRAYMSGLTQEGFRVVDIHRGDEVVDSVLKENPDIVLLDLMMPFKTGFEVLADIRSHKEIKDLPVLIFSSLQQDQDIDEAMRLGATDYIGKSNISLSGVIDKIRQYIPNEPQKEIQ